MKRSRLLLTMLQCLLICSFLLCCKRISDRGIDCKLISVIDNLNYMFANSCDTTFYPRHIIFKYRIINNKSKFFFLPINSISSDSIYKSKISTSLKSKPIDAVVICNEDINLREITHNDTIAVDIHLYARHLTESGINTREQLWKILRDIRFDYEYDKADSGRSAYEYMNVKFVVSDNIEFFSVI